MVLPIKRIECPECEHLIDNPWPNITETVDCEKCESVIDLIWPLEDQSNPICTGSV